MDLLNKDKSRDWISALLNIRLSTVCNKWTGMHRSLDAFLDVLNVFCTVEGLFCVAGLTRPWLHSLTAYNRFVYQYWNCIQRPHVLSRACVVMNMKPGWTKSRIEVRDCIVFQYIIFPYWATCIVTEWAPMELAVASLVLLLLHKHYGNHTLLLWWLIERVTLMPSNLFRSTASNRHTI